MNRRDGETIWVHDEAVVEHDAERGFDVITGFILDITAEQRANESLAAAESRYRTLVEHLPLVMYIAEVEPTASKDQVVRYVSPQIADFWISSRRVHRRSVHSVASITHPDDVERVYAEWLADPRAPHTMEYRMVAADGRVVWIRDVTASLGDAAGGPDLRQGFLVDVTNEREAREALRSAEERYRNLVERLPLVTYVAQIGGDGPADFPSTYVSPRSRDSWASHPRRSEPTHGCGASGSPRRPSTRRSRPICRGRPRGDPRVSDDPRRRRDDLGPDGSRMVHEPGGRQSSRATSSTSRRRDGPTRPSSERRSSRASGMLAGGIAHDFNNLLVSILGNAELAAPRLAGRCRGPAIHRAGRDRRPPRRRPGPADARLLRPWPVRRPAPGGQRARHRDRRPAAGRDRQRRPSLAAPRRRPAGRGGRRDPAPPGADEPRRQRVRGDRDRRGAHHDRDRENGPAIRRPSPACTARPTSLPATTSRSRSPTPAAGWTQGRCAGSSIRSSRRSSPGGASGLPRSSGS